MKRYVFIEVDHLSARGYNKAIEVYLLKRYAFPEFVGGNYKIQSASWKGDRTVASEIISERHGHKLDQDGYNLLSQNIEIRELR